MIFKDQGSDTCRRKGNFLELCRFSVVTLTAVKVTSLELCRVSAVILAAGKVTALELCRFSYVTLAAGKVTSWNYVDSEL